MQQAADVSSPDQITPLITEVLSSERMMRVADLENWIERKTGHPFSDFGCGHINAFLASRSDMFRLTKYRNEQYTELIVESDKNPFAYENETQTDEIIDDHIPIKKFDNRHTQENTRKYRDDSITPNNHTVMTNKDLLRAIISLFGRFKTNEMRMSTLGTAFRKKYGNPFSHYSTKKMFVFLEQRSEIFRLQRDNTDVLITLIPKSEQKNNGMYMDDKTFEQTLVSILSELRHPIPLTKVAILFLRRTGIKTSTVTNARKFILSRPDLFLVYDEQSTNPKVSLRHVESARQPIETDLEYKQGTDESMTAYFDPLELNEQQVLAIFACITSYENRLQGIY
jgi:hypothetical protein